MDTPKISKLLRLMKLLTGNVSRTIDSLAKELGITPRTVYRYIDTIREAGFVVNKLYDNVYAMGKVSRGLSDFKKLIYFTEEEAYLAAKIIEGIDNNNALTRDRVVEPFSFTANMIDVWAFEASHEVRRSLRHRPCRRHQDPPGQEAPGLHQEVR